MAAETPRWYQNPHIRRYLARSEYITAFTNWLMGLIGRATEIVLYATVLYSSAQLYPHVQLPAGLSLAVFLIQMGALDVGGLSLGKLAKQARADGNTEGAEQAAQLSKWLIGIMLAGVVTIGLEHALPFALPNFITVPIDVALVVARSICAVLYGRAVHDLKQDAARLIPEADVQATITQLYERLTQQAQELTTAFNQQLQQLSSELSRIEQSFQQQLSSELSPVHENFHQYQELLAHVPAMKAQLQHIESSTVEEVRRLKALLERQAQNHAAPPEKRPVLRALPSLHQESNEGTRRMKEPREVAPQAQSGEKFDARAFVFACLTENPDLKLSEIETLALSRGQELSQPTASRYRRQFFTHHESSAVVESESSTMKVKSHDESPAMKAVGE